MKKLVLIVMSLVVLLLAAGADHANQAIDRKAQIAMDMSDSSDDADIPMHHVITANIFNSLVQIPHLVFHSDLIFEFDLPEITETKAHSVLETALNFTKHYRTLFQFIISTNAP
jgi:hypothetical protein